MHANTAYIVSCLSSKVLLMVLRPLSVKVNIYLWYKTWFNIVIATDIGYAVDRYTHTKRRKSMLQPKLAIIEDDNAIAAMYEFKLQNDGYDVKRAADGKSGLELLQRFQPEIILLDLKMPVMGGDEMLARLRETEWGASVRVIVLTNISRDEAPSALRFLNVDRYLVKAHHTPKQIVDTVNDVLGKRGVQKVGA